MLDYLLIALQKAEPLDSAGSSHNRGLPESGISTLELEAHPVDILYFDVFVASQILTQA
jgi:hypothetical protein